MSETTNTPAETTETETATAETGPKGGQDALKADLARERRQRQNLEKQLRDIQSKVEQAESASLTELERERNARQAAEARIAATERDLMIQRVAHEKGVPAEHKHRLVGETEDDLAADADALLALLNTPTSPKPDPSQGARNAAAPQSTEQQFAAAVQGLL